MNNSFHIGTPGDVIVMMFLISQIPPPDSDKSQDATLLFSLDGYCYCNNKGFRKHNNSIIIIICSFDQHLQWDQNQIIKLSKQSTTLA